MASTCGVVWNISASFSIGAGKVEGQFSGKGEEDKDVSGQMATDVKGVELTVGMSTAGLKYQGSADAIYQSMNLIKDADPDYIVVFGADHVYRMDPRQMLDHHITTGAAVTVAGIRVPRDEAFAFGCIDAGEDDIIRYEDRYART